MSEGTGGTADVERAYAPPPPMPGSEFCPLCGERTENCTARRGTSFRFRDRVRLFASRLRPQGSTDEE
jgi:hypothetical protein